MAPESAEQVLPAQSKLQQDAEASVDPAAQSEAEMRQFFRVNPEKQAVDDMQEKIIENLHIRLSTRQIGFYAFLNKQFNIMNFKAARCSMHCFDTTEKPLREVNSCLQVCRQGIKDCQGFANARQQEAQTELEKCQAEAKDQKNLTDPVIHWASCYEKLISKFDVMETAIEEEFDNYI